MIDANKLRVVTGAQDAELMARTNVKVSAEWPEFMLHDPVADYFTELYEKLPEFQFVIVEDGQDEPVALGNSIPLDWQGDLNNLPDNGWDWALAKGIKDFDAGNHGRIQCALQVVIFGNNRGRGISSYAVQAMKQIGAEKNLNGLIAPVRPSRKCEYPLTPINNYIKWTNDTGCPFDPWLRVHYNLGAKIIKPCPHAMRIPGTVAEWESWAKMRFPESGKYVVPGALEPVDIDIESDTGLYIEPNVWMHHPGD